MRALKWARIRNGYYATRYGRITIVIERQSGVQCGGRWLFTLSRDDGARIVRQRERLSECREAAVSMLDNHGWLASLLDRQLAETNSS